MNWILKQKKKEHVLFTLPLPEPPELLNRLREKFPDIDFEYIQFGTLETFRNPPTIPRGDTYLPTYFRIAPPYSIGRTISYNNQP